MSMPMPITMAVIVAVRVPSPAATTAAQGRRRFLYSSSFSFIALLAGYNGGVRERYVARRAATRVDVTFGRSVLVLSISVRP